MLHNLIDIASKGGNYLLNVGPTSEGLIPGPSVERLAEVGKWMKANGEAIYGSSASPFKRLAFGRCTQKPGKLYLEVFNWPEDGNLVVPIGNKVSKAYLLTARSKDLKVAATDGGAQISVPAAAPDPIASVVVVEINGQPQVIETTTVFRQDASGAIKLLAADADIKGSTAQLEARGGQPNIGFWSNRRDYVQWPVQVERPGTFDVELSYACEPGSEGNEFSVVAGDEKLTGKIAATRSWDNFTVTNLGTLKLDQTGSTVIAIKPANTPMTGAALMNLRSLVLKPSGK